MPGRERDAAVVAGLAGIVVTVVATVLLGLLQTALTPPADANPQPSTTTTTEPFCTLGQSWCCEGESLVIPGTGVVDFSPRCEQPLQHAPEGTGPNTGPRGEQP